MAGADGKRGLSWQPLTAVDAAMGLSVHEDVRRAKPGAMRLSMNWRMRLEPMITPVFRAWWRVRRPMTLGVRVIACDENKRVLLIRHTYADGWHLPGGGVDHGETALQAALRELAEEGGVAADDAHVVGFYSNHTRFKNDHIVLYRADEWRPCAPHDNGEIAERGFFAMEALPTGVTLGTRRRLAETFEGAPPSPVW